MGTARKVARRVSHAVSGFDWKRAGTAFATGGISEQVKMGEDTLKDITGATAMEDAAKDQKRLAAEAEATAAAEEKQATLDQLSEIEKERKRRLAVRGRASTILTGALGETGSISSSKTLLGA